MHNESHPLAGKTVVLNDTTRPGWREIDPAPGVEYRVEDWWDKMSGGSWMDAVGNPAVLLYADRVGRSSYNRGEPAPLDDEVVYGKIGSFGHLVHASELGEEIK